MKQRVLIFGLLSLIIACKSSDEGDKKAQLEKLKQQQSELITQIAKLEAEVALTDTTASENEKVSNVVVSPIVLSTFKNYVEVQGKVDADENTSVSSEMGGMVTKINVKVGDEVRKGQILAETDGKVYLQGIAEIQNGLELATTLYEKQKNLWDQKIGTEVQFLSAKNQKESLEKKMATLQQQLAMTQIKSPINGIVDAVDIKIGQTAFPGMPSIRVLNFENLTVKAEVPETFASKIKKGNAVDVIFIDDHDTIHTQISYASRVISAMNRSFEVQINLDRSKEYHPNTITVLHIVDYIKENAIVIPVNTIQKAEEGDFVFISENNKARKVRVKSGHIYNGNAEILSGLKVGDKIIVKGFQELNEGEEIKF